MLLRILYLLKVARAILDLAKVLRLPRNLTRPCESVAPATKSAPNLAKVLRLPRNLHAPPCAPVPMGFAMRPCQRCGNAAPATKSILGLAKVLRLPRKCCACHETVTLRNLRAAVPMAPRPRPFRARPAQAPRQRHLSRICSSDFLHPATLLRILYLFAGSESFFLINKYPSISFRTTEVASKLPLTIGKLPHHMLHAKQVFFPKERCEGNQSIEVAQLRPITIQHVINRVISSVMARKAKSWVVTLVDARLSSMEL